MGDAMRRAVPLGILAAIINTALMGPVAGAVTFAIGIVSGRIKDNLDEDEAVRKRIREVYRRRETERTQRTNAKPELYQAYQVVEEAGTPEKYPGEIQAFSYPVSRAPRETRSKTKKALGDYGLRARGNMENH